MTHSDSLIQTTTCDVTEEEKMKRYKRVDYMDELKSSIIFFLN